jgi:hypothetical protein
MLLVLGLAVVNMVKALGEPGSRAVTDAGASKVDDNHRDQTVTTIANRSPGITGSQPEPGEFYRDQSQAASVR